MLSCWRRGEADDVETFSASLAVVLDEYPEDVQRFVTDPRTGLPSRQNFRPTVKELRDACEEAMEPHRRAVRDAKIAAEREENRMEIERFHKARAGRKTYDELADDCAKSGVMIGKNKVAVKSQYDAPEKIAERLRTEGIAPSQELVEQLKSKPAPIASDDDPTKAA